ncbi:MAG: SUMF1/EgtB/PvdO family nonheme iron enzyme [Pyrinomonadaceae bacterium]|nr:SUMF1/EgtB/PvdO family nonheme iron enzyme [Pyrinomonadaceae bacterium]
MNDENDKPKDDGWGMTMPHLRQEKEKNADGFSDDFAPNVSRTPNDSAGDEWEMTAPNLEVPNDYPPSSASSAYDKTAPSLDIPPNDWQDKKSPLASPPADDWAMNAPNVSVPPENKPDDWAMNAPNFSPPKPEKKSNWSMPTPVFRVSEGENIDDVKRTAAFKLSDLEGFDKDLLNLKPSAALPKSFDKPAPKVNFETPPPVVPNQFAVAPPVSESSPVNQAAESSKPPEKKKTSKIPFIMGGLLAMLLFAGGSLAGVYFLFLNKSVETASKIEPVESEATSETLTPSAPLTAPMTTQTSDLPKQIEYQGAMVLVAAGEFTMGSDTDADEAKPAHKVVLPAFYIDKTEVTNAEYKAFCDATGKSAPTNPHIETDYFTTRPNAPVVGVSFADAKAYADWARKRLPTEAEWEKAASWDEAAQTKREFPWGNDFQKDKVAFEIAKISDVGKFSGGASASGALDMAGNVLEWVDAFFQPYPNASNSNPEFGEKNRVVRGGHFASKSKDSLKTTKRIYIPPTVASGEDGEKLVAAIIGFRCAVSADDSRVAAVLPTQGK